METDDEIGETQVVVQQQGASSSALSAVDLIECEPTHNIPDMFLSASHPHVQQRVAAALACSATKGKRKKRRSSMKPSSHKKENKKKFKRDESGSSFIVCPICSQNVPIEMINFHVRECPTKREKGGERGKKDENFKRFSGGNEERFGGDTIGSNSDSDSEAIAIADADAGADAIVDVKEEMSLHSNAGLAFPEMNSSAFRMPSPKEVSSSFASAFDKHEHPPAAYRESIKHVPSRSIQIIERQQAPSPFPFPVPSSQSTPSSNSTISSHNLLSHTPLSITRERKLPHNVEEVEDTQSKVFNPGPLPSSAFTYKRKLPHDGCVRDHRFRFHIQTHHPEALLINHLGGTSSLFPCISTREYVWFFEWSSMEVEADASSWNVLHRQCFTKSGPDHELLIEVFYTCSENVYGQHPRVDLSSPDLPVNRAANCLFDLTPSMLKSLLQKNIRQSRPRAAVRSAMALIVRAGFVEFVRRISIICMEDAILHPHLPLVVWLAAVCSKRRDGFNSSLPAAKGSTKAKSSTNTNATTTDFHTKDGAVENQAMQHWPTADLVNACLALVRDVAAVGIRDRCCQHASNSNPLFFDADLSSLLPVQRSYVLSLVLRAELGGMEGDVSMMNAMAVQWKSRFEHENRHSLQCEQDKKLKPREWLPFLTKLYRDYSAKHTNLPQCSVMEIFGPQSEDVILSAIDNHCSNIINLMVDKSDSKGVIEEHMLEQSVQRKDNVDIVQELSKMLWRYRSSITNKIPLSIAMNMKPNEEFVGEDEPAHRDQDSLYKLFQRIATDIDRQASIIVQRRMIQQSKEHKLN